MPTTVITGANSGIAHAWSKILIEEGHNLIACDVTEGEGLQELRKLGATTMHLDITDMKSIETLKEGLKGEAVDFLLNVAGIMLGKENDALETCSQSMLERTFAVNAYGPFLLSQALLPNLLLSQTGSPKIGIVSSRVGSMGDNSSGGIYAYRASKAALNSLSKSMAVDLKDDNIAVVILHPGFVKTPLDPDNAGIAEAIEPHEAASKLWKLFQSKDIKDTGKFWHREGYELPW